jgi:hypothetical protein
VILEAYAIHESPQQLAPAPAGRDWMEEFAGRHAYRCLPVAIGNTYGWQLLLPVDVTAEWNGGPGVSDIAVLCSHPHQAVSHFQCGVLTFDVAYIFRTPPGYHLLVTGPTNVVKDGVAPMTALVESDWLPYTFTFNYRFTRPGRVNWKAGEPYAQICVVQANLQQSVQPVIRRLGDNPQLTADHLAWRARRSDLLASQRAVEGDVCRRAWDKDYFYGRYADGRNAQTGHTIKLRPKTPVDERTPRDNVHD